MGEVFQIERKLPSRWTLLRWHAEQNRLVNSEVRFRTVAAGRRSGKTEIAKRKLVRASMRGTNFPTPRFFAGAPTRDQAKRIWWDDLKQLSPARHLAKAPSESDLTISFTNGAQLSVIGMDKPERIEGTPWDGGVLDEYGNMKEKAWQENVRPALSDRHGWCWLIGVPEGRNHYYDLDRKAKANVTGEWDSFHWLSADILPASEIAAAKEDLDELTYQQEYEGSFISFEGRAYYSYDERYNDARIRYNPAQPLILCFDFNVAPGVCVVLQEKTRFDQKNLPILNDTLTCIIGEVHISRNSNTPMVCRKIIQDWGTHTGQIYCYGDATGGSKGSAKVAGSDWDLIKSILNAHFGEERMNYRIKRANPPERSRINAMNSRLRSMEGIVRLLLDPSKAPWVKKDLEGVQLVPGGAGEIDKKETPELSHLSDALGYYVEVEFPVTGDRGRLAGIQGV